MDREDGYMAMIEAQKRAFLAGKDRKGQKATNKASRREIEQTYSSYILRCPPMHQQTRTSFVSFAYPPSTRAIQDLEPIRLSDLRLETHHTGRVLIVRAFTQAKRVLSVQVGIEDELGDVDHLALYNGDPKLTPTEVLAKDAVFAVKEPHYKAAASGGYIVRVGKL